MSTADQIRTRLDQWNRARPVLEELQTAQAQRLSTAEAIACFDGLFESALENSPKRLCSGLSEQQAWFKKAMPNDQAD